MKLADAETDSTDSSIQFHCYYCGRENQFDARAAGTFVECDHCRRNVIVPKRSSLFISDLVYAPN